jgi:AAA-like domain
MLDGKNVFTPDLSNANQCTSPCYPNGAVPLDSSFYLERAPLEEQIYQEIRKPGALVRIKAPREMGKTSLLLRILDSVKRQGYYTVSLNLEQVDREILSDLNQFLRWLCANVSRQLQLKPKLDEYWDEDLGSKISCTAYIQDYILEPISTFLVLALDEVNQIFEHPQVAKDFFSLLRSWYEEAKTLPIWQKLRLIVVHSTEIYVPLQLNQSPFNVGLPIQLIPFSKEDVQHLAQRYGFDWKDGSEAGQMMDMVGGHPALVQIAFYYLSRGEIVVGQLLEISSIATRIYFNHLQRHRIILQEQPELANAFDAVRRSTEPVKLASNLAYKLSSLGLIRQSGDKVIPSCELYRQSFCSGQQLIIRRRGVILTATGLQKVQKAKLEAEWQENFGKRYTLEELNERMGLSLDTIMKIFAAKFGVDKQSLTCCFQAFDLLLESEDYYHPVK